MTHTHLFDGFPTKVKKIAREEKIQIQVSKYLRLKYPSVLFICDLAAGMNLGKKWNGLKKVTRTSRGMPDIYIYHQKMGVNITYCGLAIELKAEGKLYKKDGSLRAQKGVRKKKGLVVEEFDHLAEQASVHGKLRTQGWMAEFSEGFNNTRKLIDNYLAG